jgi:hypothetical protein
LKGKGKTQVTIVFPLHTGPEIFWHSAIEPGQESIFSGIRLHRLDVMEILKLNFSENIFIRRRSAPFPPALKS